MITKKSVGRLALIALAACIAVPASAKESRLNKESGFYLGASLGTSKYESEKDLNNIFDFQTSQGQDASDTTWSLSVGYRFLRYVGVEASYTDLGATTIYATGTDIGFPIPARIDGRVEDKGASLAVIGAVPVNDFELTGKLGVFFADTKVSARVSGGGVPAVSFSDSANTSSVMFGVGAGYTFAGHIHVKFDLTRYGNVGDEKKTGKRDITTFAAGIAYRF